MTLTGTDTGMPVPADPRYPIGQYRGIGDSPKDLEDALADIRHLPALLEQSILDLDADQLAMPYREGGWDIRQLIHHVADSHMNAYVRCRLALTEERPVIKPYDQDAWAGLPDSKSVPVNVSLTLLHALHTRWHATLLQLGPDDWSRTVFHPEQGREITVREMTGMYAWHGRHHVAQVMALRERMGW